MRWRTAPLSAAPTPHDNGTRAYRRPPKVPEPARRSGRRASAHAALGAVEGAGPRLEAAVLADRPECPPTDGGPRRFRRAQAVAGRVDLLVERAEQALADALRVAALAPCRPSRPRRARPARPTARPSGSPGRRRWRCSPDSRWCRSRRAAGREEGCRPSCPRIGRFEHVERVPADGTDRRAVPASTAASREALDGRAPRRRAPGRPARSPPPGSWPAARRCPAASPASRRSGGRRRPSLTPGQEGELQAVLLGGDLLLDRGRRGRGSLTCSCAGGMTCGRF